jgi:hypothetical protein
MKATEYYWLRPSGLSASYKFFISLLHISHSPVHKRLLEFTQKKFSPREWKLLCNYMNDKCKGLHSDSLDKKLLLP